MGSWPRLHPEVENAIAISFLTPKSFSGLDGGGVKPGGVESRLLPPLL
jgi:hypothetical protein